MLGRDNVMLVEDIVMLVRSLYKRKLAVAEAEDRLRDRLDSLARVG